MSTLIEVCFLRSQPTVPIGDGKVVTWRHLIRKRLVAERKGVLVGRIKRPAAQGSEGDRKGGSAQIIQLCFLRSPTTAPIGDGIAVELVRLQALKAGSGRRYYFCLWRDSDIPAPPRPNPLDSIFKNSEGEKC